MANYRNPNGYGSITKLSGKRRNPYVVRKTVGYDDRAYPIYVTIGYFPTRKDAMIALAEYNHSPYDIDLARITFKELYDRWCKTELPKKGNSSIANLRAAYKHCTSLNDKPYKDIRKFDMQECIDNCGKSYSTQAQIRNLFVQLDAYAYDQDIIKKGYSSNLTTAEVKTKKERHLFPDDEVKLLHSHQGEPYIDEALFMLYSGCRVSEMLLMKCKDIDLEQGTMRGGVKTAAGKERIIPIHPLLLPIIKRHLSDDEHLFAHQRSKNSDNPEINLKVIFSKGWTEALQQLGMQHTTHDCRHTFRSKLDSADANKVCIDLIMGHKATSVGERVYTHKTIEELKTAIGKLSYGVSVSNT